MKMTELIYSEKLALRVARHFLFWVIRFLLIIFFSFCVYLTVRMLSPELYSRSAWLLSSYKIGLGHVLIDILYCYLVVYVLIPRFLGKGKYFRFFALLTLVTVVSFGANVLYLIDFFDLKLQQEERFYRGILYEAGMLINSGPPVVCMFFLALKMLKDWYAEQRKKLAIAQEQANAEMELLKAQMHPHFLFNTLNNIYAFTLVNPPLAASMVTKLTGMMEYMDSEGEKDRVTIEKEIELIRDYIELEKVRYGQRLDIHVEVTGDYRNKFIAPLLLITFVENAFKHGASINRGNQWLRLLIAINHNHICFDISNSKSANAAPLAGKKGIGLQNVRNRLQLLYPGKHALQVIATDSAYAVHLEIELGEAPVSYFGQDKPAKPQLINYV
jgi:sensor histidine kinase YesM